MTDCLGEPHEFHFRSHLVATGLVIDALELKEGVPSGYEGFHFRLEIYDRTEEH